MERDPTEQSRESIRGPSEARKYYTLAHTCYVIPLLLLFLVHGLGSSIMSSERSSCTCTYTLCIEKQVLDM
jgi:hypothetical protein